MQAEPTSASPIKIILLAGDVVVAETDDRMLWETALLAIAADNRAARIAALKAAR